MSVKDTLVKAREILVERGVTREGGYVSQDGCKVCALGAVQLALGGEIVIVDEHSARIVNAQGENPENELSSYFYEDGLYSRAARKLNDAMIQFQADRNDDFPYGDITDFNDVSESDDEVLEVFDRAIKLAE